MLKMYRVIIHSFIFNIFVHKYKLIFSFITTVFSQYITRCIRLGREWYRMYVCTTRGLFFFCGWRSRWKVRDGKVIRHGGKIPGAQLARLALYVISVISGPWCSYLRWPSVHWPPCSVLASCTGTHGKVRSRDTKCHPRYFTLSVHWHVCYPSE